MRRHSPSLSCIQMLCHPSLFSGSRPLGTHTLEFNCSDPPILLSAHQWRSCIDPWRCDERQSGAGAGPSGFNADLICKKWRPLPPSCRLEMKHCRSVQSTVTGEHVSPVATLMQAQEMTQCRPSNSFTTTIIFYYFHNSLLPFWPASLILTVFPCSADKIAQQDLFTNTSNASLDKNVDHACELTMPVYFSCYSFERP